jgi:hypothetical protein
MSEAERKWPTSRPIKSNARYDPDLGYKMAEEPAVGPQLRYLLVSSRTGKRSVKLTTRLIKTGSHSVRFD